MTKINQTREIAAIVNDLDKEREKVALAVDHFAYLRRSGAERIAAFTGRPVAEILEDLPTVPRPKLAKDAEPELGPLQQIEGPKHEMTQDSEQAQ